MVSGKSITMPLLIIVFVESEQTWSCVCSLSGYHDRDIYHVDW